MITRFYSDDTIKMKITVIAIWLIAISIVFGITVLVKERDLSTWMVSTIVAVASLSLLAILLRCNVGRWFILLGIYTFMLTPIMFSILPIFILPTQPVVPINLEYALVHLLVGVTAIYFISNRESMEIFYTSSSFLEHLLFLFLSIGLIGGYIYLSQTLPFLNM